MSDATKEEEEMIALPPPPAPVPARPRVVIIGHVDSRKYTLMAALATLNIGASVVGPAPPSPGPVPKPPKEVMADASFFPEPSTDKRAGKRDKKSKRPPWRR